MGNTMGGVVAAACGDLGPPARAAPPPADFWTLCQGVFWGPSAPAPPTGGPWRAHHRCLHPTGSPPPFFPGGLSGHDPFVPASTPLLLLHFCLEVSHHRPVGFNAFLWFLLHFNKEPLIYSWLGYFGNLGGGGWLPVTSGAAFFSRRENIGKTMKNEARKIIEEMIFSNYWGRRFPQFSWASRTNGSGPGKTVP